MSYDISVRDAALLITSAIEAAGLVIPETSAALVAAQAYAKREEYQPARLVGACEVIRDAAKEGRRFGKKASRGDFEWEAREAARDAIAEGRNPFEAMLASFL